jgi:hypothetical protein
MTPIGDVMHQLNLSNEEFERLALFALGFAVGLALFSVAIMAIEEWVIAADQADRRRIREVVYEMLEADEDEDEDEPAREQAQAPSH